MQADGSPTETAAMADVFFGALKNGRLMIQRCSESGRFVFFPRALSPWSGMRTLEWVQASGAGVVYSITTTRRRVEHGGDYKIALVELDEGPRILSRIADDSERPVRIGDRVKFSHGLPIRNLVAPVFVAAAGAKEG